jgi:(4-(4-[2-(gamma-L-glutamylamino)ethyl]phenoxymethyl)furan-2-yl)methanamine synthase
MSDKGVIGWDIGGAHLKAVLIGLNGHVQQVAQVACPLWKGLHELEAAINKVLPMFDIANANHAVTMTGELADCFKNRHDGVCQIATVATTLLGAETVFYAGSQGYVRLQQIEALSAHIASMNWHASAVWLTKNIPNALIMDIGSTTTDLMVIHNHQLMPSGTTDADRLSNNSLIYTGVVRTPLMAVAQKVHFDDAYYHVAAEHFATTADVYRLLNYLLPEEDLADTADGKGKTALDSARRIARMIGYDLEAYETKSWVALATEFKALQIALITTAASSLLNESRPTVIGLGQGRFLAKEVAYALNCHYKDVAELIKANEETQSLQAAGTFPAFAVASLVINYGVY